MKNRLTHLISLGVGTTSDEHAQTYQEMSELARNLTESHGYVDLTSELLGEDDEEDDCPREHLHHDENTLLKVHTAMIEHGLSPESVEELINALQNAGILFRERCEEV